MATKLTKPVTRELVYCRASKNGRVERTEASRPIMVTLDHNEKIVFRVKGTKRRYTLHLISAFQLAKANTLIQEYNNKMKVYKERKENRFGRVRKPKKPFLPWDKNFFQVLA